MKKAISLALALALLFLTAAHALAGSSYITGGSELRGADYTAIPALANRLDTVFSGKVNMFTDIQCKRSAAAYIGSRDVPVGRIYYTKDLLGNVYSGSSCYIYANAVYSALFGDVPYHGDGGSWSNSVRVLGPADKVSRSLFASAGVTCGALLRTTKNADGSYNSNYGHSVIILNYDSNNVTYLEGNGDSKGLIRVTTRSWESFNSVSLSGRGYKLCFVVQPTQEYYFALLSGSTVRESRMVGYISRVRSYTGSFRDVPLGAWYCENAVTAYELGMMNGRSGYAFAPNETITVCEAVAMAARFLSLYYGDGHVFEGGGTWYAPYYDYLKAWGINTDFASPAKAITRGEFATLMERAMPRDARSGSRVAVTFPDVSGAVKAAAQALAETGVVNGSDGLFRPERTLTRAEAAAILSRMADESLRL